MKLSYLAARYIQSYVLSKYAQELPYCERERYISKLHYWEFTEALPDPHDLNIGWIDDPTEWPDVSFGDVYQYLIETPGRYTNTSLKAYKSLDAYEYVKSDHVQPILYHPVSEESPFCSVKSKIAPSQRLRDKPHQPWVCLSKESAAVVCAHCTCMAG